jgi:hypothetical protein
VINTLLFCYFVLLQANAHTKQINHAVETLSKSKEPADIYFEFNFGFKNKLDSKNIPYKRVYEPLETPLWINPVVFFDSEKYEVENNILIEKKP